MVVLAANMYDSSLLFAGSTATGEAEDAAGASKGASAKTGKS
jgi:hypothetical protein